MVALCIFQRKVQAKLLNFRGALPPYRCLGGGGGGGAYAILCLQPPCSKQKHSSLAAVSIRLNAVESVTKVLYCKILRLTGHLGSGQFGTVHKGVWSHPKGIKEVAVKTLKEDATQIDRIKFLQEAVIMGQFRHPSVILLYGVVGRGNTVSLVAMNA